MLESILKTFQAISDQKIFFCIFRPKWPLGLSLWREHAFQRLSPWPLRGKIFFCSKSVLNHSEQLLIFLSIFLSIFYHYHNKFDNKNPLSWRFSFTSNRPPLWYSDDKSDPNQAFFLGANPANSTQLKCRKIEFLGFQIEFLGF